MPVRLKQGHSDDMRLPFMRLTLDDLESIEQLLTKEGGAPPLIEAEKYELDTVGDVAAMQRDRLKDITFTHSSLHLTVALDRADSRIKLFDDSVATQALAGLLRERLVARRRRLGSLLGSPVSLLFLFIGFGAGIPLLAQSKHYWGLAIPGVVACIVGAVGLIGLAVFMPSDKGPAPRTLIFTRPASEVPPWLVRNRDGLLLTLVGAVVGAVLGIVGTLLVTS